jgi:hypothetical protein
MIIGQGECPVLITNSSLLRCRKELVKSLLMFDPEFRMLLA